MLDQFKEQNKIDFKHISQIKQLFEDITKENRFVKTELIIDLIKHDQILN